MRPAFARIDLDALRHNYRLIRQAHGGRLMAVLKADAYGHGAVACARALEADADGFVVAFLQEALELRAAGITRPILLIEGVFDVSELDQVVRHGLWLGVHHEEQVRMIEQLAGDGCIHVWLKVNSGMNRAGFSGNAVRQAWQRLQMSGNVADIVLMSHFARADEPDIAMTREQIAVFEAVTHGLPGKRSLSNSAGILAWPQAVRDWARAGIVLYGIDPMLGGTYTLSQALRPVMTLGSAVMAVRDIEPGASLGYGGRFVATQPMRIGLVAMGYADGYPRATPDGIPVMVAGERTRLVGRVSMDMLTIDLTQVPAAGLGSEVELWGKHISVNRIAAAANTIGYELLCNVKRVRYDYLSGQDEGVSGVSS